MPRKKRNVSLHIDADFELAEAVVGYAKRRVALAFRFNLQVKFIIKQLQVHADRYPIVIDDCRRVVLPGFPYAIIYRIIENQVLVLAIAHAKREPTYWLPRI